MAEMAPPMPVERATAPAVPGSCSNAVTAIGLFVMSSFRLCMARCECALAALAALPAESPLSLLLRFTAARLPLLARVAEPAPTCLGDLERVRAVAALFLAASGVRARDGDLRPEVGAVLARTPPVRLGVRAPAALVDFSGVGRFLAEPGPGMRD